MKKTSKNTSLGMALGMCFGVSIGTSMGLVFDNMGIGISLGLCFGMAIGLAIGAQKDKEVNEQVEEKGYTIKKIGQNEVNREYAITIVDKLGEERVVIVPYAQMEAEAFSMGDIVFLNSADQIEQVFDKT